MAFNGSGVFNRIYNWVNDKANGYKITASRMDGEFDGIATGLSNCITKDGQTTISANIPFSTYKLTGLGSGTARTDAINVGQVQDNQFLYLGTTSGSADAYTLAPSPAITAYTATQQFTAKINATNLTTTPYLQVSAIANPTTTAVIKKLSATKTEIAVEASDLLINGIYDFKRNSANDAWIVLNPEKPYINLTNGTKATTTTQGVAFLTNPITIANNATDANNDIDFSAGVFQFSDGSGQAVATAIMTKRLDATWSAGTNQGGLLNGTAVPKAINSTYHCYKIYNPTTGVEDSAFLLGIAGTAPDPTSVLPSGFTKFKRVASILTDGSGNIRTGRYTFFNGGYEFEFTTQIVDASAVSLTTTKTSLSITAPVGIKVKAFFYTTVNNIVNAIDLVTLYEGGTSIINSSYAGGIASGTTTFGTTLFCKTNLSKQIDWKTNNYTLSVSLTTFGFIDYTN